MMTALCASITVRPARPEDLPRLGRLGTQLAETHHRFDTRRFLPTRDRMPVDYATFLANQLANADAILLVADDRGDVIGYAYVTIEGYDYMALRGPAGVIQDVLVEPASRRQGVGRALIEAVIAAITRRGASQIVLSTAAQNHAAQRLFASAGFRRTMIEMTRDADEPSADASSHARRVQ